MVSPEQPVPGTVPETTRVVREERGVVREPMAAETPVTAVSGLRPSVSGYFWRGILAGTLTAITFTIMSYALMIGVGVGIYQGEPVYSWGVGIWAIVTTALAYFLGGYMAGRISNLERSGWLSGLTLWGTMVPLLLVLTALTVASGSAVGGLMTRMTDMTGVSAGTGGGTGETQRAVNMTMGGAWALFIALAVGLVFAIIGGMSGTTARNRTGPRMTTL